MADDRMKLQALVGQIGCRIPGRDDSLGARSGEKTSDDCVPPRKPRHAKLRKKFAQNVTAYDAPTPCRTPRPYRHC